ncbi:VOC family protein [uncultured Amnibacterium sp.]|uniref:VOC family protein n=1 Tax=uncultured Amnibacterium sp. TaxID=1631851 RepID=UPI0035CA9ADC
MFESSHAFSGISVDNIPEARRFYGDILGFPVKEQMGGLRVALPGGSDLWIYPKPNHQPATFTVLNFPVDDIDAAVQALHEKGVDTRIYDQHLLHTDERGISRGRAGGYGPDIAWFRDPAGNVLAVLDDGGAQS